MKTILFLCFIISALFGYNNNLFSQNITAKQNKQMVDSLMNTINPNAKLHWITSNSVSINGTSLSWNYQYGSFFEDTHTNYFFHTTLDSVVYDSLNHLVPLGIMYIDTSWIDSDSALVLAESEGKSDFRDNYTSFKIIANLGKPLVPNSTTYWYIWYISIDDPSDRLLIYLDATENTISDVGKIKILPTDLVLYQNYPNPFNPITTIEFHLSKTSNVNLKIFNILGEEVATIVSDRISAGSYTYEWDASNLASGIYLCRLEAEGYVQTKKIILMR